jgi:hypothetical protein
MSTAVLQGDPLGQARYRTAIVKVLAFAVEKLNDKGASLPSSSGFDAQSAFPQPSTPTPSFSLVVSSVRFESAMRARGLGSLIYHAALAFFRIEGVALKLLRALPPVKRQCLKRVLDEAGVNEQCVSLFFDSPFLR